jgi:hypothetical protein
MTVTQLCANSNSYEITQWIAYYKIKAHETERERKRDAAKSGGQQKKFSIFDVPER